MYLYIITITTSLNPNEYDLCKLSSYKRAFSIDLYFGRFGYLIWFFGGGGSWRMTLRQIMFDNYLHIIERIIL